jgi:hypothetical protein
VPPEHPAGRINVTDPDSRTLKTPRGFLQGYNAQAVCNEQQIVVAAEVSVSSADFGQMGPMIDKARAELTAAGVTDQPSVILADAGYWHGEQIDRLMGEGVHVLVPPDADKRRGARPGWDGERYAFMRNVLHGMQQRKAASAQRRAPARRRRRLHDSRGRREGARSKLRAISNLVLASAAAAVPPALAQTAQVRHWASVPLGYAEEEAAKAVQACRDCARQRRSERSRKEMTCCS